MLNGRYGPYMTDKERNARIPKGEDPKSLTLGQCRELLAAAPPRGKRGFRGRRPAPAKPAAEEPPKKAKGPATARRVAGKAAKGAGRTAKPRTRRKATSPGETSADSSG